MNAWFFLLALAGFSMSGGMPGLGMNSASAATGFGSRNKAPDISRSTPQIENQIESEQQNAVPLVATKPLLQTTTQALRASPEPPPVEGIEWLKIPFEKAENEVLALFQRDLPKLEEVTDSLAIYKVSALGALPSDYRQSFRSKLERVLLTSQKLKVKDCTGCEESRLIRSENGQIRYESVSTESGRAAQVAHALGIDRFLLADVTYTAEDLRLRVRMIQALTGDLLWSKEYSTADVVKTREALVDSGRDELGNGDSLARVIIGEIAFTTVLSPGFTMLPTVNTGAGSELVGMPSFDFMIGERYDRNRKAFGLLVGIVVNPGSDVSKGAVLPWALKIAPQFRYFLNPYNSSTARYSLTAEIGGMISSGMATGYVGFGPEISMIQRFSVSLMPIYILSANVADSQTLTEQSNGNFQSSSSTLGKMGGLGVVMKVNINW